MPIRERTTFAGGTIHEADAVGIVVELWWLRAEPSQFPPAVKKVSRAEITDLQQILNIGPSIAADLRQIGVSSPHELLGKDPYAMYDELCRITGVRHDPCLLDVFIAASRFMAGEPAKPWWKYTPERKRTLAARLKGKA